MSAERSGEHLGLYVEPELKQRIRIAAAEQGKSMSEFARETLDEATEE